jgi:8-oxo-dGTP pyrophosphatase MutT (NUDIX family)
VSDRRFERIDARTVHEGNFIDLCVERFRYPDGEEVEREIVHHPGAVGIVCHDGEQLYLVRQPREAVGDPDSLELPAGKLEEGESAMETAKRELAEEIGKAAEHWEPLTSYYSSVGVMDEEVHVVLATGLSDASAEADENERIEVVRWPLSDLEGALAATKDAKTIIGLLLLRDRLAE